MSRFTPIGRMEGVRLAAVVLAVPLFLFLLACGPSEEERQATARAEAWAELEEAQAALNAKRADLAGVRARIAAPEEGDDAEALAAEADNLDLEIGGDAETLVTKLINYINEAEWEAGAEVTDEQRAAFAMKSAEDMHVAEEFVVKGGDYRRAVEILERALGVDPENPDLQARLAEYQEARYITADRLSQIRNGMTEAEVEAILGKVFHRNYREFESDGVFAWFYPKNPDEHGSGAAAGVFFRDRDRKIYRTDFNAVEGQQEEE